MLSPVSEAVPSPTTVRRAARPARHGLHAYGMRLGAQLLAQGRVKRGLRYLGVPVNYWRSVEFELALSRGSFAEGDRVLDVGSPKLLALYIAEKLGSSVTATDIEDYFVGEYELLRQLRGIRPERLQLSVEDGRSLTFPDEAFDKVYSISVVEHIPHTGDVDCVREMSRVLAPGGLCIMTVPFWPKSRVDWRGADFYWSGSSSAESGDKVFFQRRYSHEDLLDRLIRPSGMRLLELSYVGERVMGSSQREFCEFLPPITGPVQPFLASRLLTPPAADWRALRKPLCALLVLQKLPATS